MAAMDRYVLQKTLIEAISKGEENYLEDWLNGCLVPIAVKGEGEEYLWRVRTPTYPELRRRSIDDTTERGTLIARFNIDVLGVSGVVNAADILMNG